MPQLELICCGVAVHEPTHSASNDITAPQLFPEQNIRSVAAHLLQTVVSKLEGHEALRSRALNSMSFSGNLKLKLNVLSGLLCLVGRSERGNSKEAEGSSLGR